MCNNYVKFQLNRLSRLAAHREHTNRHPFLYIQIYKRKYHNKITIKLKSWISAGAFLQFLLGLLSNGFKKCSHKAPNDCLHSCLIKYIKLQNSSCFLDVNRNSCIDCGAKQNVSANLVFYFIILAENYLASLPNWCTFENGLISRNTAYFFRVN